jgi:hypothetical protein
MAALGLLCTALQLIQSIPVTVNDWMTTDYDSLTRIAWLDHAISGGGLLSPHLAGDAAGLGTDLHWTLPFNLLTVIVDLPLAMILGWHESFRLTPLLSGPLFFLVVAFTGGALARTVAGKETMPWAIAWTALYPFLFNYAAVGSVNHHEFTIALTAGALTASVSLAQRPCTWNAATACALTVLALWESVESLPLIIAAIAITAAGAAVHGRKKPFLIYAAALPAAAAAALLLDPPPGGLLLPEPDRFSLLTLCFTAVASIGVWLAPVFAGNRKPWMKVLIGPSPAVLLMAGLAAASMHAVSNQVSDLLVGFYFWDSVSELRHLWAMDHDWPSMIGAALGLSASAGMIFFTRGDRRLFWAAATALVAADTALGMWTVRLLPYSEVLGVAALGAFTVELLRRSGRILGGILIVLLITPMLALCATCIPHIRHSLRYPADHVVTGCKMAPSAARKLTAILPEGSVVAADIWLSPVILAETKLSVVAGPYNEDLTGIRSEAEILFFTNDASILRTLRTENAAAIAICFEPGIANRFPPGSLAYRLFWNRDLPPWIRGAYLLDETGWYRAYKIAPLRP